MPDLIYANLMALMFPNCLGLSKFMLHDTWPNINGDAIGQLPRGAILCFVSQLTNVATFVISPLLHVYLMHQLLLVHRNNPIYPLLCSTTILS